MEHFIHPNSMTSEMAVIENIAHEVKALNESIKELIDVIRQIQNKDR